MNIIFALGNEIIQSGRIMGPVQIEIFPESGCS